MNLNRRQFLGLRPVSRPPILSAEQEAARFLAQATFGAALTLIQAVANRGIANWLADQLNESTTYFTPLHRYLLSVVGEFGYVSCIPVWWGVFLYSRLTE